MVVQDHNKHTAIVFKRGDKWVHLIELKKGVLTCSKLTELAYANRGFKQIVYDIKQACARFLGHNAGVSDAARRELDTLILEAK